jgi:hypothetical protein
MLATLFRAARKIQYAWIAVDGPSVVISEDCKTSRKTFTSPGQASAEAEKLVARREKAGWKVTCAIDCPWVAWTFELERVWSHVIEDARALGVGVAAKGTTIPGHMWSQFGHGFSSLRDSAISVPDYADLGRIANPSFRFVLGDANLAFDILFELGTHSAWGFPGGIDEKTCLWRRYDNGRVSDHGVLDGEVLESRLDGEVLRHETAEAFRKWFPRWVRDDVMGFVIAELAR